MKTIYTRRTMFLCFSLLFITPIFAAAQSDAQTDKISKTLGNLSESYVGRVSAQDFGNAVITFVRNNTPYPIQIKQQSAGEMLVDQIPEKSVVRIKSLAPQFGGEGQFLSFGKKEYLSFLKATKDDKAIAAELLVRKFLNPRNQEVFLGFTPLQESNRFLFATKNNAVQFASVPGGFDNEQSNNAHWILQGTSLDVCNLQNAATHGYFGPLKINTPSEFKPASEENLSWQGKVGAEANFDLPTLTDGLKDDLEQLSWRQILWRSNKALKLALDAIDEKTTTAPPALTTANNYLVSAQNKLTALPIPTTPIKYGDKIKILHYETMQTLCANYNTTNQRYGPAFCCNEDMPDYSINEKAAWWIVKGPHNGQERLNCVLGMPIQMGDVIRLENVLTGQNLSITTAAMYPPNTFTTLKMPADLKAMDTVGNGTNGVGGIEDNWILSSQEGVDLDFTAQKKLVLTNAAFSATLTSAHNFFKNGKDNKSFQRIVGLSTQGDEQQLASDPANITQQTEKQNKKFFASPEIQKNQKWIIVKTQSIEPQKHGAFWTGYENAAPFEDTPDTRLEIEIVKLGNVPMIAAGETLTQTIQLSRDKPTFAGFASETINDFDINSVLVLPPMLSKGIGWFNKSFASPGKFAVTFLAHTQEEGNLEIFLGCDVDLNWLYKVVIRGQGERVEILKQTFPKGVATEEEVFRITKAENSLAKVFAGQFMPYWLSFYDNCIAFGLGAVPGYNIIATWKDDNIYKQPYRLGFGSGKIQSSYTNLKAVAPVSVTQPRQELISIDEAVTLSAGQEHWLTQPLHAPGIGAINFSLQGEGEFVLLLAKSNEPGSQQYALKITSPPNNIQVLEWNTDQGKYETKIDSGKQPDFAVNATAKELWVSFDNEHIFVGAGQKFEKLKLVRPRNKKLNDFTAIGFLCNQGQFTVSNVKLSSPVTLAAVTAGNAISSDDNAMQNSLSIIAPFEYHLDQSGPSIVFRDEIQGTSQYAGKATQQGATYEFILAIAKDGLPTALWTREPENAEKLRKLVGAKVMKNVGQALFLSSGYIESSGVQAYNDLSDGKWETGAAVAAAVSAAMTTVGAGISLGGDALANDANFGYERSLKVEKKRKPQSYRDEFVTTGHAASVYEDTKAQRQNAQTSIPQDAIANKARIEDNVYMGQQWIASDPNKLTNLLALYREAIGFIIHPYVISGPSTKDSLLNNLENLYQAFDSFYDKVDKINATFASMLNTLLAAYCNPYLTDNFNPEDLSIRQVWLARISAVATKIVSLGGSIELPALKNIMLWLTEYNLSKQNSCTIQFAVKGQDDFTLLLANTTNDAVKSFQGYKVVFGAQDNTAINLLLNDYLTPVATAKQAEPILNQMLTRKFWVKIDWNEQTIAGRTVKTNKVTVGKDDVDDKNKLLEWVDPYPFKRIKNLGITTNNSAATLESLTVNQANKI